MLKKGAILVLIIFLITVMTGSISAATARVVSSPYYYTFNVDGILHETGNQEESSSPYWWLNSGAKFILSNGTGKTIQKELPPNDKWRLLYYKTNPIDTDQGYHPQNIFRLFTRSKWKNVQEKVYFKIIRDQLSASPNRDAYNGFLLMSRYQDSDNLYYAGIRVDGNAIIKKKLNGKYYTLASKKIFPGTYNRESNPNLLPKNVWIGLKKQITNNNGEVNIKLYMDYNKTGNWTLILEANDPYNSLLNEGYAGIRTDFMDVEFDDFWLINV